MKTRVGPACPDPAVAAAQGSPKSARAFRADAHWCGRRYVLAAPLVRVMDAEREPSERERTDRETEVT